MRALISSSSPTGRGQIKTSRLSTNLCQYNIINYVLVEHTLLANWAHWAKFLTCKLSIQTVEKERFSVLLNHMLNSEEYCSHYITHKKKKLKKNILIWLTPNEYFWIPEIKNHFLICARERKVLLTIQNVDLVSTKGAYSKCCYRIVFVFVLFRLLLLLLFLFSMFF